MFSAHTIHLLHVILRDTLIFLVILFAALFVWLKTGVHIDHLHFNHYEVDGLYIKLDKKLTLRAAHIIIPKSKRKPDFDHIDEALDRVKDLLTFFHYIELEKVDFRNNHYKLVYADNILYLTSDDYEIAGNVWRRGKIMVADISLFYIKKEKINMVGKLNYNLHSDKLILEGRYEAYNITGKFKAIKEGHNVEFILNSDLFSDLKTLIDRIPMPEAVNAWITRKIEAKRYRLYALRGRGKVHENIFEPDLSSLQGNALLEDVKIHFKEGLAPVTAKKALLKYNRECLYFDLTNARYRNKEVNASTVSITDLAKGKIPHLNLDMHFDNKVDEEVQEILHAYNLHIPVLMKNANSKVEVKLGIPLKKSSHGKIDVYVKAALGKGALSLHHIKLPVEGGEVIYHKGIVSLKNIFLKAPWYEGMVSGKIYTKTDKAEMLFYAKKIAMGKGKKKSFLLKDKKIPFTVYYGKKLRIEIPAYRVLLAQEEGRTHMVLYDLAKIKPFLQKLPIDFNGGKMEVWTKDFVHYTFKGNLIRRSCFIYSNKVCYTKVPCSGTFDGKGLEFYAFDKQLHYSTSASKITIRNLNLDIEKFLNTPKRMQKGRIQTKKLGKLMIEGIKSKLRYDKYTLVTDKYSANIYFASGNIKAKGNLGTDVVHFIKTGKRIKIDAIRIHDRMLHPLIHFNGLQHGRYSITLSGVPENVMRGEITLEGGMLKSFKAYNKTRTFIKNNKTLSKLEDPGLTAKGFKIREGKIKYRIIKQQKVIFDSIYIKGDKATIVGKGELNIQTKKLKIDLAIQMARKLGKIVGSLPVLGYILMGEDNSVTFGLKISGTLDNPKVETSAAKEILKLPFDLIKRTLQSPAHIINTEKKAQKVPKVREDAVLPQKLVAP